MPGILGDLNSRNKWTLPFARLVASLSSLSFHKQVSYSRYSTWWEALAQLWRHWYQENQKQRRGASLKRRKDVEKVKAAHVSFKKNREGKSLF